MRATKLLHSQTNHLNCKNHISQNLADAKILFIVPNISDVSGSGPVPGSSQIGMGPVRVDLSMSQYAGTCDRFFF